MTRIYVGCEQVYNGAGGWYHWKAYNVKSSQTNFKTTNQSMFKTFSVRYNNSADGTVVRSIFTIHIAIDLLWQENWLFSIKTTNKRNKQTMFVSNLQPKFANSLIEMLHDIWWDLDSHALVLPKWGEWNAATATTMTLRFWTEQITCNFLRIVKSMLTSFCNSAAPLWVCCLLGLL